MFGPPGAGNPLAKAIKSQVKRQDSDDEVNLEVLTLDAI